MYIRGMPATTDVDPRRLLPSVDQALQRPELAPLVAAHGRETVLQALRAALAALRERAATGDAGVTGALASLEADVAERIAAARRPSLVRVLNATGVVVHTNLGRAPLSREAAARVAEIASSYSNLEYDLESGERGTRETHAEGRLRALLGVEAAVVVNNCAAAVLLAVNTLAEGREVLVSRGELVEIGGSFRIPEVIRKGGARLVEVGHHQPHAPRRLQGRALAPTTRPDPEGAPEQLPDRRLHRGSRAAASSRGWHARPGCRCSRTRAAGSSRARRSARRRADASPTRSPTGPTSSPSAATSCSADRRRESLAGLRELRRADAEEPALPRAARRQDDARGARRHAGRAPAAGRARRGCPVLRMIAATAEELRGRAAALAGRLAASAPALAPALVPGESVVGGGAVPDRGVPTTLIASSPARAAPTAWHARCGRGRRPSSRAWRRVVCSSTCARSIRTRTSCCSPRSWPPLDERSTSRAASSARCRCCLPLLQLPVAASAQEVVRRVGNVTSAPT